MWAQYSDVIYLYPDDSVSVVCGIYELVMSDIISVVVPPAQLLKLTLPNKNIISLNAQVQYMYNTIM